ncbi:MAG: DMT family transporter [Alphaproteobacteria bacterium]|nr:DMT family transporter [Alphaproteobacteria bacterium]
MKQTSGFKQINTSRYGICYMLSAMLILVSVNCLAKDVVSHYPLLQIVFFRCFFSLIPCGVLLFKADGLKELHTQHPLRHLIGGVIGTLALICLFLSLKLMPLADAVTIHFSETFFLTVLSSVLLREHAGPHGWISIIIGFLGILIIVRPSGVVTPLGVLAGILFALGDAIFMINSRVLTRTDSSVRIVIYFTLIASLLTACFLPWVWIQPTLLDGIVLITLGIGGGIGQLCIIQAYRYAPAAIVAPMIYSALLWSVLFGYIFWDEVPDGMFFLGSSLVVLSGLYIIYQENRKHIHITAAPPQTVMRDEI